MSENFVVVLTFLYCSGLLDKFNSQTTWWLVGMSGRKCKRCVRYDLFMQDDEDMKIQSIYSQMNKALI